MDSFSLQQDEALAASFLHNGHVIQPVEYEDGLRRIRDCAAALAAAFLKQPAPKDADHYLNTIHEHVRPAELNALRLHVIQGLNAEPWLRPSYYALARGLLDSIVGNELVMQRRLNLSIQMPHDDSSLLPVHADVWSGDSPFEVVVWLPLVDCFATKAMYLMPPGRDQAVQNRLADFARKSAEDIYREIERDVSFIDIPFGKVMLFSQNLMHGNRINVENTTRWSMNCRFKSAMSPYADKKLGEFFEPITLRPATRLGMSYRLPEGFDA